MENWYLKYLIISEKLYCTTTSTGTFSPSFAKVPNTVSSEVYLFHDAVGINEIKCALYVKSAWLLNTDYFHTGQNKN